MNIEKVNIELELIGENGKCGFKDKNNVEFNNF
jgi:hypothetical protein